MYSSDQIAKVIQAKLILQSDQQSIHEICIDSRHLRNTSTSLFFALGGNRQDGHDFIPEVYEKGCFNVVVKKGTVPPALPINYYIVEDPLRALQHLAAWHRHQFDIPIVGITGSNGKTIVKEWLVYMCEDRKVCFSPKSYNSQVGVPLSVWPLHSDHAIGVFEAGISKPMEMVHLQPIIRPTLGIFTNIGSAHQQNFENLQHKANEKAKLFKSCDQLIYCLDYQQITNAISELNLKKTAWSTKDKTADYFVSVDGNNISIQPLNLVFQIPFSDNASVENAIHVALAAHRLGLDNADIKHRMATLPSIKMRMEVLDGKRNSTLISDVYSADLDSLQILLQQRQKYQHQHAILIISDILQSGVDPTILYQQLSEMIAQYGIDTCLTVGNQIVRLGTFLGSEIESHHFHSVDMLRTALFDYWKPNSLVLIKGARRYSMESLVDIMVAQKHITQLVVNLSNLAHNLKVFEEHIAPATTSVMAMVKANAYGAGALPIGRFLVQRNVQYLAVAYADEGVDLRENGIEVPIMILNTETSSLESMLDYRLEAEIYSLSLLRQYVQILGDRASEMPIHLKLNTGMNRLGLERSELDSAAEIILSKGLKVGSVFSHLAASDDWNYDDQTRMQIDNFQKSVVKLSHLIHQDPPTHILNSSGILRFGMQHAFDMVRIGIGMYGIGMHNESLKTVLEWSSLILQIRNVPANATVGYGYQGTAKTPRQIATVGVGYADGFLRALGNGNYSVRVKGQLVKTVGNICMDVCMIDVTKVGQVEVGDKVVLFGADHPIEKMAESAKTIPYEILVRCSKRVKRIYINE